MSLLALGPQKNIQCAS